MNSESLMSIHVADDETSNAVFDLDDNRDDFLDSHVRSCNTLLLRFDRDASNAQAPCTGHLAALT